MGFFFKSLGALGCTAAICLSPAKAAEGATAAPATDKPMWNLTDLFASNDAWIQQYVAVKAEAETLDSDKGRVGKSAGDLKRALDAISSVNKEASRLYAYASLKADEDISNARNQERKQQAGALTTLIAEKTAWLAPEILSLGAAKVKGFEKSDDGLRTQHGFFLDNVLRAAPHTLGH